MQQKNSSTAASRGRPKTPTPLDPLPSASGDLRERIRDPEERRRLLRLRVQSLAAGSLDVYADAEAATALWEALLLLGGVAPEADEEVGPAVHTAAVLEPDTALSAPGRRRRTSGCGLRRH